MKRITDPFAPKKSEIWLERLQEWVSVTLTGARRIVEWLVPGFGSLSAAVRTIRDIMLTLAAIALVGGQHPPVEMLLSVGG